MLQTWLIFPGHGTQGTADARVDRTPPGVELLKLPTSDGQHVMAVFGKAMGEDGRPHPDAERQPTVLFFYGNGSCLNYSWDQVTFFRQMGCNVLIPEYLGYGISPGYPGEAGCYATADAAWAHLQSRTDIDKSRIVIGGWSLGAAVAIDLASRHPDQTAGLLTFSAFTSMADMAGQLYPFLPARLILKHRFESERKIAAIRRPTLLLHGRRDTLIPPTMAGRLAAASPVNPRAVYLEASEHNDIFDAEPEKLIPEVRMFLDTILSGSGQGMGKGP